MSLFLIWEPGGGAKVAKLAVPGPGYYRIGTGLPDAHLLASSGGYGLLIANGAVDPKDRSKQLGTLSGRFRVILGGATVIDEDLVLPDGTAKAYSQPGPLFALPQERVDWLLRDTKGWSEATWLSILDFFGSTKWSPWFSGKPGYDLPEPDQAGSPRLCEYAWVGALASACWQQSGNEGMAQGISQVCRHAAADWVRLQYRRPYCYYHQDSGEPWRFSAEPDSWADEQGWRKSGKATVERPSACTYQAADPEHITLDREWAAAVLWNDPLAWRLLDHIGEALCSWPMCREAVLHGNLRAYGRTLKALALIVSAWDLKRPQFLTALQTAHLALASFPENPSPPKAISTTYTHVCATPSDQDAHPEWDTATLCQAFRAVIVPWIGTALTALQTAPGASPSLIKDLREKLMGPGRDVGGIDNDGLPAIPVPFHDSYAWKVPLRVKRANLQWNGTVTEWTACAVAALAKEGDIGAQSIAGAMKQNCPDLNKGLTVQAVECYFPLLGL